jgi:hypothetical protein
MAFGATSIRGSIPPVCRNLKSGLKGREADFRCDLRQRRQLAVASTGERNTLIFWKRWSVGNEVSYQDLLFG